MAVSFSFDPDKAVAVVSLIASKGLPELTKGKVCKLVFLIDHLHLVRYGRPVTGDWFTAMDHGPVPSNTLNLLNAVERGTPDDEASGKLAEHLKFDRSFQFPRMAAERPICTDSLSQSDLWVTEEIVQKHGQLSFAQIRSLTHEYSAYQLAWERRTGPSSKMDFEDFFEGEPEALAGVKDEMLENAAIAEALSAHHV